MFLEFKPLEDSPRNKRRTCKTLWTDCQDR